MYYKIVIDGYVFAFGVGECGTKITEEEYNNITSVMAKRPTPPSGYDYRLKADVLSWELYELPQDEGENAEG